LGSDSSSAAQSGDIGIVTADRRGNLAADYSLTVGSVNNSVAIRDNANRIGVNQTAIATNRDSIIATQASLALASQAIALNSTSIDSNSAQISSNIDSILDNRAGIASALALDNAYVPIGRTFAVSGGFGNYANESAFAGSVAYRLNDTLQVSGAITSGTDNGRTGARAGFQASW